jgi:hypothetical protein
VAKSYHLGRGQRLVNLPVKALMATPFAHPLRDAHHDRLQTGQPRSSPVRPVTVGGQRFLVASYGPAGHTCVLRRPRRRFIGRFVAEAATDPVLTIVDDEGAA